MQLSEVFPFPYPLPVSKNHIAVLSDPKKAATQIQRETISNPQFPSILLQHCVPGAY